MILAGKHRGSTAVLRFIISLLRNHFLRPTGRLTNHPTDGHEGEKGTYTTKEGQSSITRKAIIVSLLNNIDFFRTIDTDKFSGVLKLNSGDKISLPYESFSKKYNPPPP